MFILKIDVLAVFFLITIAASSQVNADVLLINWECQFSTTDKLSDKWIDSTVGNECIKGKGPGYIFYRATIIAENDEYNNEISTSVYLDTIGEADEAYVDNKLVGKTGGFPPMYLNTMHRPRMYFLGNRQEINGRELFLKIYSEFPVNRGLEIQKIKIGTHSGISRILFWEDFKSTTSLPLVLTLFLITACLTFFVYVQKSHKSLHLWAAATSLFMASYTFFLSRYGYELSISNLANYKTLVCSAMMITICLLGFSYSLAKSKVSKALLALGILNVIYLIYIQSFDSILEYRGAYKNWFILFVLINLLMIIHFLSLFKHNSRAKFMLVGTIVFFVASLNDITITLGLRTGINVAHYGLASFAFVFLLSEIYELIFDLKTSVLIEASSKTKKEIAQAIVEQNAQVAHDIRSPLAALDMAVEELNELPEDIRLLIRRSVGRIRDIANHLIKNVDLPKDNFQESISENKEKHLLYSLIESLVSEKRMQLRSQIGVVLELVINSEAYGLFCELKAHDLKRVLSNLINNSSDAVGDSGVISIEIRAENNFSVITIQDNGGGIPDEILPGLMVRGGTYNKEGGQGLGLYHAKLIVEELGGQIFIKSTYGIGTIIKILLPLSPPPDWFVPSLKVHSDSIICVLDDDSSIHQIWKERFERVRKNLSDIKVYNFSNADEAEIYMKESNNSNTIYLVDYELLDQEMNGLDFIQKMNLSSQAILVTSRFEESKIRAACENLGVRLIPKGLAGFVPIIQEKISDTEPLSVLIDDDLLIRLVWERSAKLSGIQFKSFSNTKDFKESLNSMKIDTRIYIDSNLNEIDKGEEFAKELFGMGFENIILTTGHDPSMFENHPSLKKVMGKSPPWSTKKS